MCRVFVSCSLHDRAVGERLGQIIRSLGHDPLDDRDEASGTAWWNEVVRRIESSDVFVAVVSPSYVEAQTCRLAAKHAAASSLRVVRFDLGDEEVMGCHPVVADATRVRFDPDDLWAVARVASALAEPSEPPPTAGTYRDERPRRWAARLALVAVTVVAVVAGGLVASLLLRDDGPDRGTDQVAPAAEPLVTASPKAPAPEPARAQAVLAAISTADPPGLPPFSCLAGERDVTCRNPAPHLRTVVLTSYSTRLALYDAYEAAVAGSSGEPVPENVGDCTRKELNGEVAWNLDRGHRLDFTVAQHEQSGLDPVSQAAGRIYCSTSGHGTTLVWTQDPGLVVAAVGKGAAQVLAWWQEVHLELACAARGSKAGHEGCRGLAS